ncbi:histidine kinase, partial [Fusobacterium simiae]|uniref:histidine kinase n=2 Tax=Fusobacteriaceae TaxID=203492 RepID=UPI002350C016
IYYYVNTTVPEFQTLSFSIEKLYFTDKIYIKNGEEAKKVISKIKRYLKENHKILSYTYEANEYSGLYYFKNLDLTIFFEKYGRKKIVDGIDISLPYEDNPDISEVGKILGLEILENIL